MQWQHAGWFVSALRHKPCGTHNKAKVIEVHLAEMEESYGKRK